eukprot:760764-Hanusia_phi.AAC.2
MPCCRHAEQEEEAGMYLTRPSDASFVLGGAALGAAFGGLISYSRRQDITTGECHGEMLGCLRSHCLRRLVLITTAGLLQGASAGIIGGSLAQVDGNFSSSPHPHEQAAAMTLTESARHR